MTDRGTGKGEGLGNRLKQTHRNSGVGRLHANKKRQTQRNIDKTGTTPIGKDTHKEI